MEPFIAKEVVPGEPLTAQAWNDVVGALARVDEEIRASAATSVRVKLGNTDVDFERVRVTAVREDGQLAFEAVRPIAPDTHFMLSGMPPGNYTVRAGAPGFDSASQAVTVPHGDVVQLTMQPSGAAMPRLFGVTLRDALQNLKQRNIAVERILDVTGRDVAPANPDAEHLESLILLQLPAPGSPVAPGETVQLGIAAALQVEPTVEVPALTGLSLNEARKALESLGLVLGNVEHLEGGF